MFGTLLNIAVYLVVSAIVILIVGKLNLGLTVKSFGSAIMAAVSSSPLSPAWSCRGLGFFGITLTGGWLAAIVNLIVAALVLMIADKFLPGMEVHGFLGAIIAALAIGVVGWAVTWALSLFGIVV
jgi:putative membrane protein